MIRCLVNVLVFDGYIPRRTVADICLRLVKRLLCHIFRDGKGEGVVFIRQSGQRRPGGRGIVGRCHDRHGVLRKYAGKPA